MTEFDRIERFVAQFGTRPSPFGPGDDAALSPPVRNQVITTDAVFDGVHFTLETFSAEDVGHKALAVNLSDLAAMGAEPRWFVCALALPGSISNKTLVGLGRGMAALARAHRIELIGGNVSRANELSITITAAGEAKRPLLRSGASVSDLLYLSGSVGNAAAGLTSSQRLLRIAQRRPAPHVAWGRVASRFASAAIDVSDGLVQDAGHVALASGVRLDIRSSALPIDEALGTTQAQALFGGEDYVLLVSVPRKRASAFEAALTLAGFAAWNIGSVGRGHGVTIDGKPAPKRSGFMHFR